MSTSNGADRCDPLCHGIEQLWNSEFYHGVPHNEGFQGLSLFLFLFLSECMFLSFLPQWPKAEGKCLSYGPAAFSILVPAWNKSVLRMNSPELLILLVYNSPYLLGRCSKRYKSRLLPLWGINSANSRWTLNDDADSCFRSITLMCLFQEHKVPHWPTFIPLCLIKQKEELADLLE